VSTPVPPPDPRDETPPLWRRLIAAVSLGVWPWGTFFLLFGPVAGEKNVIGWGFAALANVPWWVLAGACMMLVSTALHFSSASAGLRRSLGTEDPTSLRLAADTTVGGCSFALMAAWAADPAAAHAVGTPLWGCLLFCVGVSLIDAGHTIQERRTARPQQSENGA